MNRIVQCRWKLVSALLFLVIIYLQLKAFVEDTKYSQSLFSPNHAIPQDQYTEPIAKIQEGSFELPERIVPPDKLFISVGMIIINIKKTSKLSLEFGWKLERNLRSLLDFSSGNPLHFIIITDKESLQSVSTFLSQFVGKYVATTVIKSSKWRKKRLFPKLVFEFVNIENIIVKDQAFFNAMKNRSMTQDMKYNADLFYISPLYHKAFTSLSKIIFLDSSDLHFYDDILLLQEQFNHMDRQVIGVGLDLSPHYRNMVTDLAGNTWTSLGLPGPRQGLNTGVVLFNLDKMRESKEIAMFVQPDKVGQLLDRYGLSRMSLGDQDWLTCLAWDQPHLFYILPCQFNRQTDLMYLREGWEEVFDDYHHCDAATGHKIVHRNGCGPTPAFCGNKVKNKSKSHLHDVYLDMEVFWEVVPTVRNISMSSSLKKMSSLLQKSIFINCVYTAKDYCMQFSKGEINVDL